MHLSSSEFVGFRGAKIFFDPDQDPSIAIDPTTGKKMLSKQYEKLPILESEYGNLKKFVVWKPGIWNALPMFWYDSTNQQLYLILEVRRQNQYPKSGAYFPELRDRLGCSHGFEPWKAFDDVFLE